MYCVELAVKVVLCTHLGSKGCSLTQRLCHAISPNMGETAATVAAAR